MTLAQLLQEQKRCANRLYDEDMQEIYLALTKELNKRAEQSVLDVDLMFLDSEITSPEPI